MKTKTEKPKEKQENKKQVKGKGNCRRCACKSFSPDDDEPSICKCGHMDIDHNR